MRSLHCRQGILFLLAESISYHIALVSKNKSEAAAAFLVSEISQIFSQQTNLKLQQLSLLLQS